MMEGEDKTLNPTSSQEDFDQNPITSVDTLENQSTTPVDDTDGHVVNAENVSVSNQDQEADQAKVQAALREYGKLSQVQKELDAYKRDVERLRTIEERALRSPESYKLALMEFNGYSEEDATRLVEQAKSQGIWGQQTQVTTQPQVQNQNVNIDPERIKQEAIRAAQDAYLQQKKAEEVQEAFFSRVPDLDPRKLPPEKLESAKVLASAIEFEANRRMALNPSANFVDELVNVYKDFTGKTEEQIEQARAEGRREGLIEATTSNAGVNKPSKGYSPKESSYGLTPDELQQAKLEGLTPAEFAKLKDPIAIVE